MAIVERSTGNRKTVKKTSRAAVDPRVMTVFGHISKFGGAFNFSATRAEAMREIREGMSPDETAKPIEVTFDLPNRWRTCFIDLYIVPEWIPVHVLDCPPKLSGCYEEYESDVNLYHASRKEAIRACAETNAGRGSDGYLLKEQAKWCFVVEFGRIEQPSNLTSTEFHGDEIGLDMLMIHRPIRMVKPTHAERAQFDEWKIGAKLPEVGDPSQWRKYFVFTERYGQSMFRGNFESQEEAKASADKENATRSDYYRKMSAAIVIPPGQLPGLGELKKRAKKLCGKASA